MYRKIEDFKKDWADESEATLKVLKSLTDASLSQRVTPDGRSLGFLAWHIVTSQGEMLGQTGLATQAPEENAKEPSTAAEIVTAYERSSRSVADLVLKNWTDASLLEEVEMYGQKWTRGYVLASLIRHETHHRAQMTVLMRQAGLKVPGVYGPSREEWAQFGMPPQK
ncbi:MAG: DinB family protein [candidate division KSB1 bacterium]|nr:DinB family protein [candidate division KSB1 bacterium]MDZ7303272.1 DinB family protein [candidate division KSB1 bacterium]MDZ7312576.1 DinB family protein [candidate division KSB1 bacterium]